MRLLVCFFAFTVLTLATNDTWYTEDIYTPEFAQEVGSAQSLKALDSLLRYGGYNDLKPEFLNADGEEDLIKYITSVGSLAAYGLLPAVLLLVALPFWCTARLCCKCCQGHARSEWNRPARLVPLISLLCAFCVLLAFSGFAFVANESFANSIWEKNVGAFDIVKEDVVKGLSTFLGQIYDKTNIIYVGAMPNGTIDTYVSNLTQYEATIDTGNSLIIQEVSETCNTHSDTSFIHESNTYDAPLTADLSTKSSFWIIEIDSMGHEVWSSFKSTLEMLQTEMLAARADIFSGVELVQDTLIVPAENATSNFYDLLEDNEDLITNIETHRNGIYIGFFVLPLLPLFCILPAICKRSPCMFTMAYTCTWFIAIILFFILGAHVPLGGAMMDVCQFLDDAEIDGFQNTFNKVDEDMGMMGQIMDACLTNDSLVVVFNLESELNFTSQVKWPAQEDMSPLFQFSGWETYADSVQQTLYYDAFDNIITSCSETPGESHVELCYHAEDTWIPVQQDSYDVDDIILDTQNDADTIQLEFLSAEIILNPIFEAGDDIVEILRCGFIGDAYWDFKERMCQDCLKSIALMCACLAISACFSVYATFILVRYRKLFKTFETSSPGIEMNYQAKIKKRIPGAKQLQNEFLI